MVGNPTCGCGAEHCADDRAERAGQERGLIAEGHDQPLGQADRSDIARRHAREHPTDARTPACRRRLADLLLRKAFGGPPAEAAGVRLASYGLIALIGMAMTGQALRRSYLRRRGVALSHGCCGHEHERFAHDHASAGEGRSIEQGGLSLGVGLVQCTGAVLILLYAMANDILFAGMLLAAAIAAGMAITMGALGIVSVVARRVVARRIEAAENGQGRLAVALDYAGALAITALGGGLFWAAL
jgi:nickel/cobalt transporter (NicO) family protein